MKKWLSAILTIVLLFACFMTVSASAAETVESGVYGDAEWSLDSDGVLYISGSGTLGTGYSWDVPESWHDSVSSVVIADGIDTIAWTAFSGCYNMTSIQIPDSVTYIDHAAFEDCVSLGSIVLPSGLKVLEEDMFYNCNSLYSVTLPEGLEVIGHNAFLGCSNLSSVNIPSTVTTIDSYAFYDCSSLTDVSIPASVSYIGEGAFIGCDSLTAINVAADNTCYSSDAQGGLYNADKTELLSALSNVSSFNVHAGITGIGDTAFAFCGNLTELTIPKSVEYIGSYCFYGCDNLASVVYKGSEEGWNEIEIGVMNTALDNATITFGVRPLAITANPTDVTAVTGSTALFIIEAEGEELTYQWQFKTAAANSTWRDSTLGNPTTDTLTVAAEEKRSGYSYRCVITDSKGRSVTSDEAVLNVVPAIVISEQPVSVNANKGGTAVFTVAAEGEGLTYQWQFNTPNNAKWRDSSAATIGYNTDTLTVSAAASRNGYGYRCVITDSKGNTVITDAVQLIVR